MLEGLGYFGGGEGEATLFTKSILANAILSMLLQIRYINICPIFLKNKNLKTDFIT